MYKIEVDKKIIELHSKYFDTKIVTKFKLFLLCDENMSPKRTDEDYKKLTKFIEMHEDFVEKCKKHSVEIAKSKIDIIYDLLNIDYTDIVNFVNENKIKIKKNKKNKIKYEISIGIDDKNDENLSVM